MPRRWPLPRAHYDIIIATDARLPGGTTASVAEEIVAQHAAGYRTGLLHVPSSLSADPRPVAPRLQALVRSRRCELVTASEVEATAVVFRHPRVAQEVDASQLPRVETSSATMVANQAPADPTGALIHFDPEVAHRRLTDWLGVEPRWAPIGPLVRRNLEQVAPNVAMTPDDWVNVIDTASWYVERSEPRRPVRIGRHSRDHALKWPATREELLAAYPPTLDVRVLGGARTPKELLGGRLPPNWTVYRFDEMPVRRFLAELDVFVYHHHPAWVEAFGRTIIEALAAGLPVVVPQHFRPLFGEVATYASPEETADAVREVTSASDTYRRLSELGRHFVDERFSHRAHRDRIEELVGPPSASVSPATVEERSSRRTRALFVSSNGAGVGHLMRLMAIARRLPDSIEPVFLTLSQAVGVVRDLGFHVEYLPSRGALDAPHALWHDLLERRVVGLIDTLDLELVVFDGTWPYNGLISALERRPSVRSVWSRRGMWREDVTKHRLDLTDRFTAVIEPGEFARNHDRGPTSRRRHEALQIAPITFLRDPEALSRSAARDVLGLDGDADRRVALVQLGAGNINDTSSTLGEVTRQLLALDPDLTVCVTRSAIANADALPAGVRAISSYPLSRVFAAFDLAVAASGYNTFHELLIGAVPTAFIPNLDTATDDQLARARWADQAGLGVCMSEDGTGIEEGIRRLLAEQDAIRERLGRELEHRDGAEEAAAYLASLVHGEPVRTAPPSQLRPTQRPTRTRTDPRGLVLGLLRSVYRRLPPDTRRTILRLSGRMTTKPSPLRSARTPIPLPGGRGADPSTTNEDPSAVLVRVPDGVERSSLEQMIAQVVTAQRLSGGFVPLFLTTGADLQPFRLAGYGVEVLPDADRLESLVGDVAAEQILTDRLAEIQASYGIRHVVPLSADDDAVAVLSTLT